MSTCVHTRMYVYKVMCGPQQHLQQYLGTVVVVFLRFLDKTETIDITNIALPVGAEEVKPTHCLLQEKFIITSGKLCEINM